MNITTNDLGSRHCRPYDNGEPPLSSNKIEELAKLVPKWSLQGDTPVLAREFEFGNYYETVAFVNAVTWVANQQDHHPDIRFGYKKCMVEYTTHSVGGLSENDFICAARIDNLNS